MKLGVVAALQREIQPTIDSISAGPPFEFTSAGIGIAKAERSAGILADSCQALVSVGFCGGLEDSLGPGDLILGGTQHYAPSTSLLEIARRAGPHRVGTIHTADRVVNGLEEKRSLARTTGAIAVDMEAAAVGKVAHERGLAFLCVKVVLDTPSRPLASTYASFGRVTLDLLKKPWLVGRMIGDGKRAKLAANRLKDFFVAFRREIQ